jgi:hypothetical protein
MKIPFRITGVLIVLLAGAPMVDPSVATAQAPPLPTSMAAIGDSFTVGFSTGAPDCLSGSCPQWSWSTGTSSTSHYVRLLALDPGIAGHAINAAVPGASMSSFVGQVATATSGGNQPGYVTVLLGAADTCLVSPPTDVSVFTAQFRAGMDALFQSSPNSRVLVASIFSLESIRSAVLADNPAATFALCSSTFFDASDAARAAIMDRLQQFNAILSTECATYANCQYDGGALFAHNWTRAEVSTVDNVHPSVAGQNMISTTLWNAGFWPDSTSTTTTSSTTTSTTTSTTLPPLCASTPAVGCRVAAPGAASVQLKANATPAKDQFKWKWAKGAASAVTDFKDPVGGSATYRVCVYDGSGRPQPLMEMDVPPGGTCGTKPCWKASGTTGFSFANKVGTTSGLTSVKLKAGSAGKAQVQAAGKGANLPLPTLGLTLPVTVQFLAKDNVSTECWQTPFTTEKKNDPTQFSAKGP